MKERILQYCRYVQALMQFKGKEHSVELISQLKPANYHVPQIATTKSVLSGDADKILFAWYCEIWIDKVCVFRESVIPNEGETETELEEKTLNCLILSVFNYGVQSARIDLEKRMNQIAF